MLERLPVDAVRCYFEPDGTFPNHEPNPLLPENREFIVAKVLEENADLGVAFDGDADRCFFVDDTGRVRARATSSPRCSREAMLAHEPGATIIYDVRASWAVRDTVEAAGGTALVNRVGHAFIKHRMRQEDAVFAGEVSGHYYFRDYFQADSGVVPMLLMLELVSRRGQRLSEILAPFRERYFLTGEINTTVADVALKLQELKERFGAEGEVSHLDGISVTAADWHMNVRPSNTEPLLRLNLEASIARADGAEARRGAGGDRRMTLELGRVTDRKPPFKYSALARVGFSDTDAQGIVYYGRYMPFFDLARVEYTRHLGLSFNDHRRLPVRDARGDRRVPCARALRRPARGVRAHETDRADERDDRVRRLPSRRRRPHVRGRADARPRRSRRRGGRSRFPEAYRAPVRAFEGSRSRGGAPRDVGRPTSRRGALDAIDRYRQHRADGRRACSGGRSSCCTTASTTTLGRGSTSSRATSSSSAAGKGPEPTEHVRIPIGTGHLRRGGGERQDRGRRRRRATTAYLACFPSTRSEIVVPIHFSGEVVGEIDIDSDSRPRSTRRPAFLEHVARMVSCARPRRR